MAFCPNCGRVSVDKYPNNRPVADFHCARCGEEYELKSQQGAFGSRVVDGAYRAMIGRLQSSNNPNFFLLRYDLTALQVVDLVVIPKHFFVPGLIEKRKPLSPTARRAGWTGCNILLAEIPPSGRIFVIRNREVQPRGTVLSLWQKTLFLRDQPPTPAKGWLLHVMQVVETLGKREFTLNEVYQRESELKAAYPRNRHVREKIRQQLQVLRDQGYLHFVSRGYYRLA